MTRLSWNFFFAKAKDLVGFFGTRLAYFLTIGLIDFSHILSGIGVFLKKELQEETCARLQ